MLGGAREDVGRQDVHGSLVGVEGRLVGRGDLGRRLVLETGRDEHPVLAAVESLVAEVADVGDVLHVEDGDAVVQQRSADEVGEEVAPQVPDVGVPVHGRAAGVHAHPPGLDRFDRPDRAAQGVAQAQGHPAMLRVPGRGPARGPSSRSACRRGIRPVARILPPMRRPSNRAVAFGLIVSLSLVGGAITTVGGARAARDDARIFTGTASTLDPAAQGDVTSASISAQLFETLTTFDSELHLQPALAESWRVEDGGSRVVFHLRPGLTFSDGTPLRASDVVRSWLRLIDPAAPSPLASLMFAVDGASAYMAGDGRCVGRRSGRRRRDRRRDGDAGTTRRRTSRTSSRAPRSGSCRRTLAGPAPSSQAWTSSRSGGYTAVGGSGADLTLRANDRYWAGRPAIGTLDLVGDLGGRSEVEVFEEGDLDYAPISSVDASWIAYDPKLGPQLREVPTMSVEYYGFDTRRAPFDDVRVRQAFGMAVDWRRIARLGSYEGESVVANSMVPPGVPGRSDRDFLPTYDPVAGAGIAHRGRLPGRRGLPDRHDADERRHVRCGHRRRGPARARHRARDRDDGLRGLLRPARGRIHRRSGR